MSSEQLIDAAGKVRAGEEVDLAKVTAFLKASGMALEGEAQLKQFPGGASNLTYLVSYANKDLILRARRRRGAAPDTEPQPAQPTGPKAQQGEGG